MNPLGSLNPIEQKLVDIAKTTHTPISGSIELLPLCNMRCNMCYVRLSQKEMEEKGAIRSADEWLDLARQMKEEGTLFLLLTGGEPLLYPDFKELYLGLKALGMVLTINTNGTLLDEEWADFFAENMPRRINITLYGIDEDTYRDLCHYPQGFSKAANAVRLLRDRNIDVLLSTSLTPQNINQIEQFADIAHELDCRCTIDEYMMPAQRERTLPYPLQARVLPEEAANAKVRFYRKVFGPNSLQKHAHALLEQSRIIEDNSLSIGDCGFHCMAANCSFTINWQGKIRPCTMLDTPSCSAFDSGFRQAWNTLISECSHIKLNPKCSCCKYKIMCRTCVAGSYLETGDFSGIADYMCRYSKELYRLYQMEDHTDEGKL